MRDKKKDFDKYFYKVKLITIGQPNVGKTNILYRYAKEEFINEYEPTISVDFINQNVKISNLNLKLFLFDTIGQEQYKSITRSYYLNSTCCIIVYDISDRSSFESINNWIDDCKSNSNENIIIILVGNKCDKQKERKVTEDEGQIMADRYGIKFFESSALTGYNIKEIFNYACKQIYNNFKNNVYNLDDENDSCGVKRMLLNKEFITDKNIIILNNKNNKKKKKCC